jgi:VWFA-related protein
MSLRSALAAFLVPAALPVALAQTPPPVFRAEVAYTHVDVFVSQGGRSVPGLRASDFELRDNGVIQQVELLAAATQPLPAVLVFDTSSSVVGERLLALRRAGEAFLDGLRPADEVSLVTFSEEIVRAAPPTSDKDALRGALNRLDPEGATAVFDALYAALALADSHDRSLVVLFTDGEDNMSILGERQLRTVAERSGALVHAVVLRNKGQLPTDGETEQARALREIADASGGRFWTPDAPKRLREAFAAIAASMGERYVLRYDPQGVKREGWHRLEIRLRTAKGSVQARRGYWVAER